VASICARGYPTTFCDFISTSGYFNGVVHCAAMDSLVSFLVSQRFKLGKERYSHGLLHEDNKHMDFGKELVEELLDAVIYAGADFVRSTPAVSVSFKVTDDGSVKLGLVVNHDIDYDDGESAIIAAINKCAGEKYDYSHKKNVVKDTLLLCMFTLSSVLRLREGRAC